LEINQGHSAGFTVFDRDLQKFCAENLNLFSQHLSESGCI